MSQSTSRRRLLRLARHTPALTRADVVAAGIHTQELSRLVRAGAIERIARGQYRLPEQLISEHHGLAVAAAAVPHGVICLLSALSFHEIGTQVPFEVWIAIDRRARRPALTEGIEVHKIEARSVRVYSIAKTLADAFKYRNKIGLDVVLEALREAWRERRVRMDDLDRFATICRVERVMRPYLEALVA